VHAGPNVPTLKAGGASASERPASGMGVDLVEDLAHALLAVNQL
jgi:hypothetical protein